MNKLKKILENNNYYSRLGKTFTTKNKYYFYDLGTGKILECFLDEYKMLKDLPSLKDLNQLEFLFSKYENKNTVYK